MDFDEFRSTYVCSENWQFCQQWMHIHVQWNFMTRKYTLNRRAEQLAETRRRIVEAAVDLHTSVGPALTSLSMIAERAGVQRHTLYAHFPDERSLFLACSGLAMERDPLPNAEPWRAIGDRRERLRTGLRAIYAWFERNAAHAACVLRDAEHHVLTKEVAEMRFGPYLAAYQQVLGDGLSARQRPVMRLALSFYTWRTLVRDGGLETGDAVEAMVRAVDCAQ
ncbi:TetR/AcrR family transcriptional regulator [Mesorhizobium sp. YC-39]|uniref:TetR/AcrR family transcriptional regulator n=1 Tax=unclassified Mesorhizobium TaxID=325217 RepID=UPI0021E78DA2|nr:MULTISPECIES: TetR/AcrR family transcriptional regulator [unclassified Mesorhizobium]MCV3207411.1 TetR/AcrR family transcriptional regulator [Mesorhizobium sp. YC-2]MCV3229138.1 TetR/AcrR family transcriptional regulator [Mesorhizobium sp. YC-39]